MLKISELLNLFKNESCKNKVDYELIKTDTPDNSYFWNFVIYYYTNLWSIEHNEPNELEIVIDENKKVMGIEFESAGDRVSITPAWKMVCKAVADELEFEIDLVEKVED